MVKYPLANQKRPSELSRSWWSPLALIDQGFFVFAGLATFWLAWLVFQEAIRTGGWWMIVLFVIFWAITAYLALPRAHRILSNFYTPDYFIGRTRTADGLLGDPINLALRGNEAQLHKAMQAAGWTLADDITPRSTWKIIVTTLRRKSYASAPISSLFLFGRRQDFAYQQEVDGSPEKRHHARFWRCPDGWLLPGGHQVDWLAAGTYDKSVGLSLFTFQITHKIDENIDIERDYIVKTVSEANKKALVTLLKDFSTGYHSRNGGGDMIETDGDLPILELAKIEAEQAKTVQSGVIMDATIHEERPEAHDNLLHELWSRRPPQVVIGSTLVALALLVVAIGSIIDLFDLPTIVGASVDSFQNALKTSREDALFVAYFTIGGAAIMSLILALIQAVFVVLVMRGGYHSRLVLLILASLAVIAESLTFSGIREESMAFVSLLVIGLNIVVVLMFSSDAARQFTLTHKRSISKTNN